MSGKDLGNFPQVGPGEAGESHPPPSGGGGGCPPDSGVGNQSCSGDLVAIQAGSRAVATGGSGGEEGAETREGRLERLREEAAAFTRSAKLARSPPMRDRAGSVPELVLARVRLPWEDDRDSADGKKRRVDEAQDSEIEDAIDLTEADASPVEKPAKKRKASIHQQMATERDHHMSVESIKNIIAEMEKEIRIVGLIAQERNTKKEIKAAAKKLLSLLPKITTGEASTLLSGTGDKGKKHQTVGKESLPALNMQYRVEQLEEEVRRLKADNTTLSKENERLRQGRSRRDSSGLEDLKQDKDIKSWENFKAIAGKSWPKAVYKRAFKVSGSILEAGMDTDLLMLREHGERAKTNDDIRRELEKRHPEIKEDEEDMIAAIISTSYKNKEGIRTTSSRWIIRAETDESDGKTLYDELVKLRQLLHDGGRSKIAAYPPGSDPQGGYTRKMLEYVFHGTSTKCLLYTRKPKDTHSKEQRKDDRKARPRADALVIEQQGSSYAALLKKVKEVVEPQSTAARAIRTIREARSGKMVIVLDKDGQHHKEDLKREIQTLADVRVTDKGGADTGLASISGIDPETTREQVAQAVAEETGVKEEDVTIGQLRESYGGNRTTTLSLERGKLIALIDKGGLRIGLNWCQIKERVNVLRCYRCWNYGHVARDCNGQEDSSSCCRRCGGTGHKAAECNQEEKCLSCKAPGHAAGSGRCPVFRKALARERNKRKEKRAY